MNSKAIDGWLNDLSNAWTKKDLSAIEKLFSEDVVYWESPFKQLKGTKEAMSEWKAILPQKSIDIKTEVLSSDNSRFTVRWDLSYFADETASTWAGLYLIELNSERQCTFFLQVGEEKR
jgi:limonene-1,2-epoxide hydrolase